MIGAVVDLRVATLNLNPSSRVLYRRSRRLWLTRRRAETRSLSSEIGIRSDPQQRALTGAGKKAPLLVIIVGTCVVSETDVFTRLLSLLPWLQSG